MEFLLVGVGTACSATRRYAPPNTGLRDYLTRHGYTHVSELVGALNSPQ